MCGITGIYALSENGKSSLNLIGDATSILHKRGPDNQRTLIRQHVALGHARLSIIDVSEHAHQPFSDQSGKYHIVFNGEIYNFPELRSELEKKGYTFRTQSDTEVLLYLYIDQGEEALKKLNGFFAFAVYNEGDESLFIARDRIGIKPLYIYRNADIFAFASELKSLLKYNITKALDEISLLNYLQLNYIPGPESVLKNVSKLEAGSYLKLTQTQSHTHRYYEAPNIFYSTANAPSYDKAMQHIRDLLENSVKKRLISDVPLGAFLSGGVDSSILVALASRHSSKLNTFSIGFKDEPFFDETHYAEEVAKKYNTRHTVFSLTTDDTFEILDDVLDYIDEPFADSSALAVYILSKHTRQHVRVALSGDGADELFAGYHKHAAFLRSYRKNIINQLIKWTSPALSLLPQSRNSKLTNTFRQINRYAAGLKLNPDQRYWRWCALADEQQALRMLRSFSETAQYADRKQHLISALLNSHDFNDMLYTDMHLVLQNDMLVKTDRMSMANSLEVRVPFLDHQLVDFVMKLPAAYKIAPGFKKKILQDAFRNELPENLYRRPKQGFEVPLLKWFRTKLKNRIMNEYLQEDFIREQGIFNYSEIKTLKNKLFSNSPGEIQGRIWGLIVFQHWWKKYFI